MTVKEQKMIAQAMIYDHENLVKWLLAHGSKPGDLITPDLVEAYLNQDKKEDAQ